MSPLSSIYMCKWNYEHARFEYWACFPQSYIYKSLYDNTSMYIHLEINHDFYFKDSKIFDNIHHKQYKKDGLNLELFLITFLTNARIF